MTVLDRIRLIGGLLLNLSFDNRRHGMNFLVLIAALFGISSAAPAVDKASALKIETYPIVADSVCTPYDRKMDEFNSYLRPIREKYACRDCSRWADSTVVFLKRTDDDNPLCRAAIGPDKTIWKICEERDTTSFFMADWAVFRSNSVIYRFRAPLTEPIPSVYIYDQNWILSYYWAHVVNRNWTITTDTTVFHVVVDGVDLNVQHGYDNCYVYFHFDGRPFYLFDRNGRVGWSYDDVETPDQFDEVFHAGCCGYGALNPSIHKEQFDFLALRDGIWYYVVGSVEESTPSEGTE
jgi:hypothetical protein